MNIPAHISFQMKQKTISTQTHSLLSQTWLFFFLSTSMLCTLTEFVSGPRVITENEAIWRMSRQDIRQLLGKSELACLAASPSACTQCPPIPSYTCSLFSAQQLLPTQPTWAELASELILLCHTPGPPAIQTNGKEGEYIITMKWYNKEVHRLNCKTPHLSNF